MPLRWEILHAERLIHVVAEGKVTPKEMGDHFDALVVADVPADAKLFDATLAEPVYDDATTMDARLGAYTATMPIGPLAVVGLTG